MHPWADSMSAKSEEMQLIFLLASVWAAELGNSVLDTCSGEVVDLSRRESELQIQINTMQLKKTGCCNLITQVPEFFCFCGLPCDPGDVRDFIFKLAESRSERHAIHARCGDQEFRARAFMHFLTQRA